MKKSVAMLCDFGMDDAIAMLYLLENAYLFNKIDLLPVAGNFPLSKTFVNAKRLLTAVPSLPRNIRIVDTSAVPQQGADIPEIHGRDGMGDLLPPEYEEVVPVLEYATWLKEVDETYVIVSLGPCTVTLDILNKKGKLPLIMMAGNVAEPPNYLGYEFNHALDPDAFAACMPYTDACATLDTCHDPQCDLNRILPQAEGLFGQMLTRYREMSNARNEAVCAVYDLTAVVYLLHPERFEIDMATDRDGNRIPMLQYIHLQPLL